MIFQMRRSPLLMLLYLNISSYYLPKTFISGNYPKISTLSWVIETQSSFIV